MLEYYDLAAADAASFSQPRRHGEGQNPPQLLGYAPGCWLNLASPSDEEISRAAAELGVRKDFITDSLDPAERPHALADGQTRLIICKVSSPNPDPEGIPFKTVPLGIIITPEAVATICRHEVLAMHLASSAGFSLSEHAAPLPQTAPVDSTVAVLAGKAGDGQAARRGVLFALSLLQQSSIRFTSHLQQVDLLTAELEPRMHRPMRNQDLVRMMQIEKTLVYFATSLKGNNGVLDKIASNQFLELDSHEAALLTDSVIECRQAADMAEIYIQILASMSNTSASMISNDMNSAMKFLTGITLVLTVPMLIAGIYGMNVPLPFQGSPLAILGIVAATVVVCRFLWVYLSKKHWM